eukprot:scaffold54541_cov50-Prasinocladus_malaysianus.AAC.1
MSTSTVHEVFGVSVVAFAWSYYWLARGLKNLYYLFPGPKVYNGKTLIEQLASEGSDSVDRYFMCLLGIFVRVAATAVLAVAIATSSPKQMLEDWTPIFYV